MNPNRTSAHRQEGSVYLIVILVLLVLTIVGLALAITTQSEMRIGANEELSRETFYSADTGVGISTAKALILPDLRSVDLDLVVPSGDPDLQLRDRLEMSAFTPIQDGPCNLCQINQDSPFFKINHFVASSSTRIGWKGAPDDPPDQPIPLAQERISVMVAFQPWRMETLTAVDALTDDNNGAFEEVGF
jgi:hypothetical protein